MKIFTFSFKSLLLAAGLIVGSANAWGAGYTRTLTDALVVSGYKAKAYYNFQNNTPAALPTSGDLRYRSDDGIWGLHNFGSGGRTGTATIPVAAGDILVIQEYNASYVTTINRGSENAALTGSTGYRVFNISTTADDITFSVPRYGGIVAAFVMEVDESAETADYTINYKASGETVKTVSGNEAVGTVIPVLSSFTEGGKKYNTDGGQATSLTVAKGGSTLNINVTEAEKYSYTVNATDGTNVLKVLASGSTYAGEQVKVAYPKYFNVNGTLYYKDVTNKEYRQNVTISENEQVTNFVYTESDVTNVVYHSEAEEITGATATSAGGNMAIRSSNAQCGYAESDLTLKNLPAGKYRISGVMYSNNSGGLTLNFQLGDVAYDPNVAGMSNESWFSQEFTLASAADVKWLTSGSSLSGLDYVYIQKVAEPVTITAAGYATYSNADYALNLASLPDGLSAYYVASDGVKSGYVSLTAASVAVEANTGLLFQGTPSTTYYVPVAAFGSPLSGNRLIATDGKSDVAAGNYVFAFEKLNPTTTAGFYRLGDDTGIDAGKAYLNTGVLLSKVLRIGDGEASEVVAPEVVETEEPEILFNMAGVQVDKNFKGFVVNQKGEKRFNR